MLPPAYAKQKSKSQKHKKISPGLAKKVQRGKDLPPVWQKKLAKGEVLSEELYVNAEPLSEKEKSKLPSSPAGTKLLKILQIFFISTTPLSFSSYLSHNPKLIHILKWDNKYFQFQSGQKIKD